MENRAFNGRAFSVKIAAKEAVFMHTVTLEFPVTYNE
jgi:hypothetical protein